MTPAGLLPAMIGLGLTAALLSGCGEEQPPPGANSGTQAEQPPAVPGVTDTAPARADDPTPQTGSGGDQQSSDPVQPRPAP